MRDVQPVESACTSMYSTSTSRVPRGEHSSYILMYSELASSLSFNMIVRYIFPQRE